MSLVLLFLAIAAGSYLRFANLGALEMSPDEGDLWATASAPSVSEVIARQTQLDAGKLPVDDLMLHGWIGLFGSSMAAMRAMSAAFGVVSILLVYFVSREMFANADGGESGLAIDESRIVAGVSAIVFAVNLVSIKYSREARMYPLMLAAVLAQVGMFLRALRRGGAANYVAVTMLTALAIGTHFAAALVPASEGIWLAYNFARARLRPADAAARHGFALVIALAAGGCILAPQLFSTLHTVTEVARGGIAHAHCGFCGCCGTARPPLYAPLTLFNKATGSVTFPILAALAIWGVIRGWRRGAHDAVGFALLWMWGAPLMMMLVSYALRPMLVERYALASFVPFFIVVGLGIFEMPSDLVRISALVLAVAFSAGHIVSYLGKPHDAQYREAIAVADAALKPGETMTAVPAYAINVLRYYLPADRLDRAIRYDPSTSNSAVFIMGDQGLEPDEARTYGKEYPHTIARLRGVTVMRK